MTQEEIDKDTKFSVINDIKNVKDSFKKEYPSTDIDIEEYYFDQSRKCIYIGDRKITDWYLPYGIKIIESWFVKQIISERCEFSKKELTKLIRKNPHLHNVIKTNLLSNLELKF